MDITTHMGRGEEFEQWIKDGGIAVTTYETVKKLELPAGLTTIGEGAFDGCAGLTELTIPLTVTAIRKGAFQGCEQLGPVLFGGSRTQWLSLLEAVGEDNEILWSCMVRFAVSTFT